MGGGDLVQVLLQQVGDHHLHAGVQERLDHAVADAGSASGDEGDLTLDGLHERTLPDLVRLVQTENGAGRQSDPASLAMNPATRSCGGPRR